MRTLDLRKELKQFYAPSAKQPQLIDVPAFQFAMLDGAIEPGMEPGNSPEFAAALEALYGISYTLKFMLKQRAVDPIDYPVMALEALWSVSDGEFEITRKDNWLWTAMILQPAIITPEIFTEGLAQLRKKRADSPALARLRLASFHEGLSVQIMHIGPYSSEPATLERMHAFARASGYRLRERHHEIYLGDPRRSAPGTLKTVLRHAVEKA